MNEIFVALIGLAVRQKRTAADRTNENIGIQSAPLLKSLYKLYIQKRNKSSGWTNAKKYATMT